MKPERVFIEDSETLFQAALWYVEKRVDFIDAFNAAWMQSRGIGIIYSFDRKHFSRFEGLEVRPLMLGKR